MTDATDATDEIETETEIELRAIDEIEPYEYNPKAHPSDQVEKIATSIAEFGWDQPIVVDDRGEIVKGHGRYEAAKRLDLDRVPVIERDLDDSTARAARIADNRSSESDWDGDLLASELSMLDDQDIDLERTVMDDDEIEDYLTLLEPPEPLPEPLPDDDDRESLDDGGEGHRVVVITDDDDEAERVGNWADENGFEWHVVDK